MKCPIQFKPRGELRGDVLYVIDKHGVGVAIPLAALNPEAAQQLKQCLSNNNNKQ